MEQASPTSSLSEEGEASSSARLDRRTGSQVVLASADHQVRSRWRQGLAAFVVHEALDVDSLKSSLVTLKPSVLLVDVEMAGLGGVPGISGIMRASARTKLVLLTRSSDPEEAIEAIKAGACGSCHVDTEASLIPKTVEAVQKGELWAKREVMFTLLRQLMPTSKRALDEPSPEPSPRFLLLTSREREVAHLVGAGARNKDIASTLKITETTVKAHLTAIFRKLAVPDRLRLALMMTRLERRTAKRVAPPR